MPAVVTGGQHAALTDLMNASGLGIGTLPAPLRQSLLDAAHAAAQTLSTSLQQPKQPAMRA